MSVKPRHVTYSFGGRPEYCLAYGDEGAPRRILIIPPLFDEMNRVRQVMVSTMRNLAGRGIATMLPDLPGCNESVAALVDQDLATWRAAVASAAKHFKATHIASIRGGALIDDDVALPHWRLAPVGGAILLKTMIRTRIIGDKESGVTTTVDTVMAAARKGPIELAGNILGPDMVASLEIAQPATPPDLRTMLLGEGDNAITGTALWLRTEPQNDAIMAASIAADLDHWSASCGK